MASPPTASGYSETVAPGTSIPLSQLFSYSPGAGSWVVGFDFEQTTSDGGYITDPNGNRLQPYTIYGNTTYGIPISELSEYHFVAGPAGTSDTIAFNVDDADTQYNSPAATATVGVQAPEPSLSSISPNPVSASDSAQTIELFGSNFASGDTLLFTFPNQTTGPNLNPLTIVSSGEIEYTQFNDQSDAGNWKVQVKSPDGTLSNAVSFAVKNGGANSGLDYRLSAGDASALTGVNLSDVVKDNYGFVGEYLGTTPDDGYVTNQDALKLSHDHIGIVSIFERTPTSGAYFTGTTNGISNADYDAADAIAAAKADGEPAGSVIYFTVDYDPTSQSDFTAIDNYFAEVRADLGSEYEMGVYGPGSVLESLEADPAAKPEFTWLDSYAWPADGFSGQNITRLQNSVFASPASIGPKVDLDSADTANFGQWTAISVTPTPPVVASQTPNQTCDIGESINLILASGTFTDPQNESLTFKAALASGAELPSWLKFNAPAETFTGTVPSTATNLNIKVTATDTSNLSNSETFSVTIAPASAPILSGQTPNQTWNISQHVDLVLPSNTFTDPQNEPLTYRATLANGATWPSWLTFDAATRTFTGTVPSALANLSIKVTATDTSGLSNSETFAVTVPAATALSSDVATAQSLFSSQDDTFHLTGQPTLVDDIAIDLANYFGTPVGYYTIGTAANTNSAEYPIANRGLTDGFINLKYELTLKSPLDTKYLDQCVALVQALDQHIGGTSSWSFNITNGGHTYTDVYNVNHAAIFLGAGTEQKQAGFFVLDQFNTRTPLYPDNSTLNVSTYEPTEFRFISLQDPYVGQYSTIVSEGAAQKGTQVDENGAVNTSIPLGTPIATFSVTIGAGKTVELASAFSGGITFSASTGTLQLDNSSAFSGTVAGMAGKDQIDLRDVAFANVRNPSYSGTTASGTLTVTDGAHTANIILLSTYLSSTFVTANDGHGGTLVTDAPLTASNQAILAASPHHV